MRLRLPLLARIVGWFLLNLGLLGLAFWLVLRSEYRLEPLMADLVRERAMPVAQSLLGELHERPRADWTKVLARYEEAYGIRCAVVREDASVVAGEAIDLPGVVRERMRPAGGPGRMGPPAEPFLDGREGPGGGARPAPPNGRRRPQGLPPVFVRSHDPDRYWFVVAAGGSDWPERSPLRLVMVSETLSAGGLFFDLRPWIWAASAVLAFSVLWWLPFVMGITRSLSRMTGTTERIAEGRFDVPTGPMRGDELGRLEEAIRRMAARLDGFVNGQKRFLGDVAHELCSPLARMEMALGILEQRADERQREYVEDVRDEVRQMSALVNELLSFSKAGLKGREVPLVAVPLAPLAAQVAAREGGNSNAVKVTIPVGLSAMADADLLARALGNLVRNALRHGGNPPSMAVTAQVSGEHVLVRVSDEGPGVPPESLARLGEPFFRPDLARTREAGGVGLGLAIVRACAAACGGTVEFRNCEPRGFEAELRLRRL